MSWLREENRATNYSVLKTTTSSASRSLTRSPLSSERRHGWKLFTCKECAMCKSPSECVLSSCACGGGKGLVFRCCKKIPRASAYVVVLLLLFLLLSSLPRVCMPRRRTASSSYDPLPILYLILQLPLPTNHARRVEGAKKGRRVPEGREGRGRPSFQRGAKLAQYASVPGGAPP